MCFSIIIPINNEQDTIKETIQRIYSVMNNMKYNWELIIVNDGSTDNTSYILRNIQEKIVSLYNEKCVGYGAAIKKGLRKAKYEHIIIADSDGTYPLDSIGPMITKYCIDDLDMLVGARTMKNTYFSIFRKPAKKIIGALANYLSERNIPDLNSGLRIMRKSILEKFFKYLPNGYSFTTTITLAMLTNNYNVEYYPIEYFKRIGKSKIRPIRDTIKFIQLVVCTVMYFNPLKVFLPLSLFLFFMGFVLLLIRIIVGSMMLSTTITVFIGAFTILSLGLLADLINKRI